MVYVNDFISNNDNDTIQSAIENRSADGIVIIGSRSCKTKPEHDY